MLRSSHRRGLVRRPAARTAVSWSVPRQVAAIPLTAITSRANRKGLRCIACRNIYACAVLLLVDRRRRSRRSDASFSHFLPLDFSDLDRKACLRTAAPFSYRSNGTHERRCVRKANRKVDSQSRIHAGVIASTELVSGQNQNGQERGLAIPTNGCEGSVHCL